MEQPVLDLDIAWMADVRQQVDLPIMADESIYNLQDALVIVRANAADILFVLLVKVGGSAPARKIASVAEATGLSLHRRQYEIRHRQRGYDPLGLVDTSH